MVTRIHVVDTLEQTQSLPLAAATLLSLSLRPPCVPGRVTVQSATTKEAARHCYRKRRHAEAALPAPATALITASARPFILHVHACARIQGSRRSELCRRPDVCVCMLMAGWSAALRCCCFYHFLQGKVGFLIFHQGHGKSPLFPFKIKMK